MDKCIDSLGRERLLLKPDAILGYSRIEMDKKDIAITAIVTHHGLFSHTQMSFRPENAPATFQRPISVIMATVRCQYAMAYIDGIITISKDPGKHIGHLNEVMKLLKNVEMTTKFGYFFSSNLSTFWCCDCPRQYTSCMENYGSDSDVAVFQTNLELQSSLGFYNIH